MKFASRCLPSIPAIALAARLILPAHGADVPLSPGEALRAFQLDPGLRIELVAAEPLVKSPAALAWDESGRLFIAENVGYPTGPGPGQPPAGAIVELIDEDHDGRPDRRQVFADGLGFPNGILPWRGGLLVTDAPNLYWLADTNHDGRADVRETWFTGFATNQSTQLRACYPTLGPDGLIYVARGWSGGVVTSPKWPGLAPVDLKDGDFRFRPDGTLADAIGGNAQFGMVLDDVGRRFGVSNRNPLIHAVVTSRWWRRHPLLPFSDVMQDVAPTGYEARVFPVSPDTTTSGFMPDLMAMPHAGTFTSACGIHQFTGEGLGAEYQGHWFICEPAQSLVQRQVATPLGPTFSSRRATGDRDFLTSSDGWFRPVFAATGPDGALYLADLYRRIIDHPDYLPEEARARLDFNSGKDRGRIWRISANDFHGTNASLAGVEVPGLIAALNANNVWIRQTAGRLLQERAGTNILVALVESLATEPSLQKNDNSWTNIVRRAADPVTGPHLGTTRKLWLLSSYFGPDRTRLPAELNNRAVHLLLGSLFHPSPAVRETTWRILHGPTQSPDSKHALPDVPYEMVYWWADDPNPAARFEFTLQCGNQDDWSPVMPSLVRVARRDAEDRWMRAAVLSGLGNREGTFLRELFREPIPDTAGFAELLGDLARMISANKDGPGQGLDLLGSALNPAADGTRWQASVLGGFSAGLRQRGGGPLRQFLVDLAARIPGNDSVESFERIGTRMAGTALDPAAPTTARVSALGFLSELDLARVKTTLITALAPGQPTEVRVAATRALGRFDDVEAGRVLADRDRWSSLPQPARDAALEALMSRTALVPALLEALERGDLPLWSVEPQRRRQFQKHTDAAIRERASRLFADVGGADRRRVFDALKPVLTEPASGARGHAVFLKACANCHTLGREGASVGPDLTGVRNQPAEALLLHIIVPDAEIHSGFQAAEVETKDGRSLTGLLASETPESVVLRRAGGEQDTLQRSNIAGFRLSRVSLMPQELERTMSRQDLADLIAFLRGQP